MSDNNYMNSSAAIQFGKGLIGKTIKPITWYELYLLRNNNNLQQGTTYRITDYHCTSMDDNAKSAGHRFDILVTAIDNKTLSEIGRAMKHEFADDEIDPLTGQVYTQEEKDYFNDIPIEAWEVHYCLDNNQQRFNWAVPISGRIITTATDSHKLAYNAALTTTLGISGKFAWTNVVGNSSYTQCYLVDKNAVTLAVGDTIELYDITNSTVLSTETITAMQNCGIEVPQLANLSYGHGVIYRLIDEHNNDVCYDFKNILFKRDADWRTTYSEYYSTLYIRDGQDWYYTFGIYTSSTGLFYDATVKFSNMACSTITTQNNNSKLPNIVINGTNAHYIYIKHSYNITLSSQVYCCNMYSCNNIVGKTAFNNSEYNNVSNLCVQNELDNVHLMYIRDTIIKGISNRSNLTNVSNCTINTGIFACNIMDIDNVTINSDNSRSHGSAWPLLNNCNIHGLLKYVTIHSTDWMRNVNFIASIIGTSANPITIEIPPANATKDVNDRAINVDVDANGNPIIYFPSDQEELIENMTATTATLYPKRMYVWGTVASLDLSFASTGSSVVNEYHFRFTADSGMTLSLPSGITWANGTVPPRTQGKTYEISIIGNYASYLEF